MSIESLKGVQRTVCSLQLYLVRFEIRSDDLLNRDQGYSDIGEERRFLIPSTRYTPYQCILEMHSRPKQLLHISAFSICKAASLPHNAGKVQSREGAVGSITAKGILTGSTVTNI